MRVLLRADWLRLRRRKDLWIIAIAVIVFSSVTFIAGYRTDVSDPVYPTAAEIRQQILEISIFDGMTQAEIDAQLSEMVAQQVDSFDQERANWEANQRIALQKYDVPQSVFSIIGGGLLPLLALVLISSLAMGDEFRFGTVRTSLLASSNRRRFLAARLISIVAISVMLISILALLGIVLGLVLRVAGAELAPTLVPLDLVSSVAWFGSQILITLSLIGLAVFLTVLLRSGALPLLLVLIAAFSELFVANLPVFREGELLSGVPQAFLTTNLRTLTARLGLDSHAVALAESQVPFGPIAVPVIGVAAIVVAWGVLFLVLADRRFRSMDVVE